jgi:S-DNA-T family DNA segregation ATPase FtsK/SpoIIIE
VKLKVTVVLQDKKEVDLLLDISNYATVGDLAQRLIEDLCLPLNSFSGSVSTLVDQSNTLLSPTALVTQELIPTGSRIRIGTYSLTDTSSKTFAAELTITEGVDKGKSFQLPLGISIIGRDPRCEVQLSDNAASRFHSRVSVGDEVEIVDLGSINGIEVDGVMVERAVISDGGSFKVGETVFNLRSFNSVADLTSKPLSHDFNRRPTVVEAFDVEDIPRPEVPGKIRSSHIPIIPLILPLFMGAAIYLTSKSLTSIVFLAFSPLMVLGSNTENRFRSKKDYDTDVSSFRSDLELARAIIDGDQESELSYLNDRYPDVMKSLASIKERGELLWSRNYLSDDFMVLVVGVGQVESKVKLKDSVGSSRNTELELEIDKVVEETRLLNDAPVRFKLNGGGFGVGGDLAKGRTIACNLIYQLVSMHSPSDLKVAAMISSENLDNWMWLKWLPHSDYFYSPFGTANLATSADGCDRLLEELEEIVANRRSNSNKDEYVEQILVVVDDRAPFNRPNVVRLMDDARDTGVSFIWTEASESSLPHTLRGYLIYPSSIGSKLATVGFVREGFIEQVNPPKEISSTEAASYSRELAPLRDLSQTLELDAEIPTSVTMAEIAGGGILDDPKTIINSWVASRSIIRGPYATTVKDKKAVNLRATIGISSTGPIAIDLRSQGPHALVGGTTGSGKSELLQSWILGLAIAHSPQRVNFLLVDYKGGSAFAECTKLPHTVGLVTDLNEHLIDRALKSLSAELKYRERLLHAKGAKDLMDLEKRGEPDCPPVLVIVIDEFAALVQEIPEFIDGVVDIAQRGRSLGLHLILATQRPAGVIRDNLRANTNLRISLRMADDSDAQDVVGVTAPAAFDPAIPGRTMVRFGPQRTILFQSAYVGGWSGETSDEAKIDVFEFGFGAPKNLAVSDRGDSEKGSNDISRIVKTIESASGMAKIGEVRRPWLPSLPDRIALTDIQLGDDPYELVIGISDDPDGQVQPTATYNPATDGNLLLVGAGGSGKTNFLKSLAFASAFAILGDIPTIIYCLDFAGKGLSILEEFPYVGSVISGDDRERTFRLIKKLGEMVEERQNLFARSNASSIEEYWEATGDRSIPRALIFVDGIAGFRAKYEATTDNDKLEKFALLMSSGRAVGITFILTTERFDSTPRNFQSALPTRIALRVVDQNEYMFMNLRNDLINQDSPPGRCIYKQKETQLAAIVGDSAEKQNMEILKFATMIRANSKLVASAVEGIPSELKLSDDELKVPNRLGFGIEASELTPISVAQSGSLLVVGPPLGGRSNALRVLLRSARASGRYSYYFHLSRRYSDLPTRFAFTASATGMDDVTLVAKEIESAIRSGEFDGASSLIVIENVSDFSNSVAEGSLKSLVDMVIEREGLVISDGEPLNLNSSSPLLNSVRITRTAIFLKPEAQDGGVVRSQFGRINKSDFPPGRALLVERGLPPVEVQIALE